MGVPKHKVAKTKSRMRKSNSYYRVKPLAVSKCPNCGALKLPHRICPECGYYKGRQIITRVVKGE
ncbi:MAG: 50S ribosomal protein L32 [Brevinematia bacterium]